MNKQVLISVRPENAVNILNGKKTIELRKVVLKWVLEEIKKGNTVIFNVYVTKDKKYILHKYKDKYYTNHYLTFTDSVEALNSKVVASFEVSKIERFEYRYNELDDDTFVGVDNEEMIFDDYMEHPYIKKSCVELEDWVTYSWNGKHNREKKYKDIYALHISNLNVFDKPKELSDYVVWGKERWCQDKNVFHAYWKPIKAPQNMMTRLE